MRKKFIDFLVEKLFNCEDFQKAFVEKIKEVPIRWCWTYLNKCYSEVNGYLILHDSNQMVPWIYNSEEAVREQVNKWDKVIADYKEKSNTVEEVKSEKPKRKYTKRKKKEEKK